ncbi:hypothetical protein GCM10023238_29330 [Streptomyces heliomycini]
MGDRSPTGLIRPVTGGRRPAEGWADRRPFGMIVPPGRVEAQAEGEVGPVILTVALNTALDITHHVPALRRGPPTGSPR